MRRRVRAALRVAALSAVAISGAVGCAGTRAEVAGREPLDRRAALATLRVDNRTGRTLAIRFRYASSPDQSVEVGRVAPGQVAEMAPVPAQEPIFLEATGDGLQRRLGPRTFTIDTAWTWVIADPDELRGAP